MPTGVYERSPHSEETKRKISLAQKGVPRLNIIKEKHWNWKGGRPCCIVCNKQLVNRKAIHCRKHAHKPLTSEHQHKMTEGATKYWTGRKLTEAHKDKLRGARPNMRSWNKGKTGLQTAWNKGKVGVMPTPWNKGKEHKAVKGENHSNWKGGISTKPEYYRMMRHNRRALLKGNGGKYTVSEWLELKKTYDHRCLKCLQQEPDVKLSADHIVPLTLGGRNDIGNIQPLCISCNCRKRTKVVNYKVMFNLDEFIKKD